VTVKDVADSLVVATSSSRYVAKNYWRDPRTGVDYQIQVQVPGRRMSRPEHIENVTLDQVARNSNLMLRDLASVRRGTSPGEIDRSSMQRYLSVVANVEGEDLGRAAGRIERAIANAGQPPRGVRVQIRGQVVPMEEMFQSLSAGLALSVVVTLVLLTGYFQSFRLGLVSIGAVPGVICGVAAVLWSTGTTLNIESFMGSIMSIGVSVSNSVMLVTFMNDYWKSGMRPLPAAVKGAKDRLRPILMTAFAMVLGTLPMAMALEKGSEMTSPLGRAVIGGLVVSTLVTLFVVPAIFVVLMRRVENVSPSLDPNDPHSRQYDSSRPPESAQ
jgi:multidrug efflux pump subunit AcrB